ncbi:hypothetical protein FWH30_03140 [Microgenomates group bacterium]|nr:hypothetical protein [Microgenomates group bacterium]
MAKYRCPLCRGLGEAHIYGIDADGNPAYQKCPVCKGKGSAASGTYTHEAGMKLFTWEVRDGDIISYKDEIIDTFRSKNQWN